VAGFDPKGNPVGHTGSPAPDTLFRANIEHTVAGWPEHQGVVHAPAVSACEYVKKR
jgi:hypothetical protein